MGARARGGADVGQARGVRRVAAADDHDGVHLVSERRGRFLALARSEADGVLHLGPDAARGERLDHRVQRLAGLRRLHDDAHWRLDARRQVARGGDHEHLAPRFARVGHKAFHLGMALLPHHHDAAAAACEIGGGLLCAGDVRARGVDEGQLAFFHRAAHRGGHAVTADDHRAALDVLGAVDRADAARRQFGHHLRIVDERAQRGCALAAGAGLDGHVERALHAVARPGVACLHHSHATS